MKNNNNINIHTTSGAGGTWFSEVAIAIVSINQLQNQTTNFSSSIFKLNPKNQNFNLVTRVKINYSQKQKTHFNKNEKNGIFNCSTSIYIIDLTNNIVTPKFHIT